MARTSRTKESREPKQRESEKHYVVHKYRALLFEKDATLPSKKRFNLAVRFLEACRKTKIMKKSVISEKSGGAFTSDIVAYGIANYRHIGEIGTVIGANLCLFKPGSILKAAKMDATQDLAEEEFQMIIEQVKIRENMHPIYGEIHLVINGNDIAFTSSRMIRESRLTFYINKFLKTNGQLAEDDKIILRPQSEEITKRLRRDGVKQIDIRRNLDGLLKETPESPNDLSGETALSEEATKQELFRRALPSFVKPFFGAEKTERLEKAISNEHFRAKITLESNMSTINKKDYELTELAIQLLDIPELANLLTVTTGGRNPRELRLGSPSEKLVYDTISANYVRSHSVDRPTDVLIWAAIVDCMKTTPPPQV